MAYHRLNERSIRLFVATPEELAKNRPNLNAPYFRVKRSDLQAALEASGGQAEDVIMSLSVWKRAGRDGRPDYFTAEITFPDDPNVQKHYLEKDDEWRRNHPKSVMDAEARKRWAMNKQAEKTWGGELPDISKQTFDAVMKGFDELTGKTQT